MKLKKKDFTITKENFLNWAFNMGYDDEQESQRLELGKSVVNALLENGKFEIDVEDLFSGHFELSIIPLRLTEECDEFVTSEENQFLEICDVAEDFTIRLVD